MYGFDWLLNRGDLLAAPSSFLGKWFFGVFDENMMITYSFSDINEFKRLKRI